MTYSSNVLRLTEVVRSPELQPGGPLDDLPTVAELVSRSVAEAEELIGPRPADLTIRQPAPAASS